MHIVISGRGTVWPDPVPQAHTPPSGPAFTVGSFDGEALLGRRTAQYNHRSAQLAMVACGRALDDAGLEVTDENRDRIGVTLGTAAGSVTGMVEFGMDTFSQPRPHMVAAAKSSHCVLSSPAGAAAITYGLRGANATVASGPATGLAVLRHAVVILRAGHADAVLAGASEEFTGPTSWLARTARGEQVQGEGAAAFVLEGRESARAAGRKALAAVAAVDVRAVPGFSAGQFAESVARTLGRAGVSAPDVSAVAFRHTGVAEVDEAQHSGLARALPGAAQVTDEKRIGDCYSAHALLQLAGLLDEAALPAVVVAADPDGLLSVAVLNGVPE
ncbi:beta-ketoacyl synthase N-terminal-like domain-containing protein [Streptomyces orinoci]|uniref:Beta-ketoacyl synthase N-terminal-like domain-containing protein n=1 Tax=Streptomyces orinoci TaxID=67339 RepID=A0ABV3K7R1_STRON|nr:beta-ketoacyl synthase N-terminal-like domain-containing protein [Streptomyces orinoci]